jgi:NAD(P) transhydrogenase subunit alpha
MSPAFIKAEMEMFAAQAKDVDIIIPTALDPESPAADPDHRRDGQVR